MNLLADIQATPLEAKMGMDAIETSFVLADFIRAHSVQGAGGDVDGYWVDLEIARFQERSKVPPELFPVAWTQTDHLLCPVQGPS